MASSVRVVAAVLSGMCLAACGLPAPDYKVLQYPAPFRKEPDGAVLDNEDTVLDAQGYRVDKKGNRIGEVDIQAKTANEKSNAVAGFYISSQKANAPGAVMEPSVGAGIGAGYGVGSGTAMPSGTTPAPAASGQPVPLAATPVIFQPSSDFPPRACAQGGSSRKDAESGAIRSSRRRSGSPAPIWRSRP